MTSEKHTDGKDLVHFNAAWKFRYSGDEDCYARYRDHPGQNGTGESEPFIRAAAVRLGHIVRPQRLTARLPHQSG